MKTSTFTEEQIVLILRQAETREQTIGAVCHAPGSSENNLQVAQEALGFVLLHLAACRLEAPQCVLRFPHIDMKATHTTLSFQ